jgi:hypothetical protein
VRRVELHIPSISSPLEVRRRMPNRRLREGGQLSRLCAVADPLVEVVYVSPCVLPETVMAYYRKMIEVGRLCPWGALAGCSGIPSGFRVVVVEVHLVAGLDLYVSHRTPPYRLVDACTTHMPALRSDRVYLHHVDTRPPCCV